MYDDAASRKSGNRTAYEDGVGSHEPVSLLCGKK
jgi:hypothetical protein